MLDVGSKCICSAADWYNAFGNKCEILQIGMRLTVKSTQRIAGTSFLTFEEVSEGNYYMASGFKSLRSLN